MNIETFVFLSIADDFEDDIELENKEDEGENFELLTAGGEDGSGGVETSKRITTKYMTK